MSAASRTSEPETAAAGAPDARIRRRVRRLRITVLVLSLLTLVSLLAVAGVLVYWDRYLLGPSGSPFTRGPFLVRLSTTRAELRWRLDHPAPVDLRAVAPGGVGVQGRDGVLAGLRPNTAYAWTAAVGGKAAAGGTFTTAPLTLARPVTFGVIGDYGSGNDHEWAVGRALAAQAPRFVLTAGDNSYLLAITPLLDRNIFEPLHAVMLNAPLWPTYGEHDLFWQNGDAVTHALDVPGSRGRWTMGYGPIQVVALGLQADPSAVPYVRHALAVPGYAVRFVLVHRPIQPGNPILPVLRQARVAAILAGHLHRYERRVVGGVLELTIGTSGEGPGGAQFTRPTPGALVTTEDYGLVRVDVSRSGVRYAFVDERGRVADRTRTALRP